MKRKLAALILAALLLAGLTCPALADMGPKPSVNLRFAGLGDAECWATMLSPQRQWGPYAAPEVSGDTWRSDGDDGVWEKFAAYDDPDGYYFLQYFGEVTGDGSFSWTYYPPEIFKVLLYFPAEDRFISSGVYKAYAFDSYYTFTLREQALQTDLPPFSGEKNGDEEYVTREPEPAETTEPLTGEKTYDYAAAAAGFAARLLGTLALELLLAAVFGYRSKRAFGLILPVNLLTQTALNAALNLIRFRSGPASLIFWYVVLELAVCAAEAAIYARRLPRIQTGTTKKRAVCYAAAANLVSFGAGLALSLLLPDLF